MKKKKLIPIVFLYIILFSLISFTSYFIIRRDKPRIIKPFQDPFVFENGTNVETEEDWDVRREEIKELLLDLEYGHMPGRPDAIKVKIDNTVSIKPAIEPKKAFTSSSLRRWRYSDNTGTNACEKAPSANKFRKKFGIR